MVWSTLKDVNKCKNQDGTLCEPSTSLTHGLYNPKVTNGVFPNVYHFDSKAEVGEYMKSIGLPTTFFMPGFYMSNLPGSSIRKDETGTYVFNFPGPGTTQIPLFDANSDTGKYVKAALKYKDKTLGKAVLGSPAYYTIDQIVDILQKTKPEAGKGARHQQVPPEGYKAALVGAGMPDFAAQELLENMTFMSEFGYYGKESLDWSNDVRFSFRHTRSAVADNPSRQLLDEKATTWEKFVEQHF